MKFNRALLLAISAATATSGAVAQSGRSVVALEEILVTARKRIESVQDVPLQIVPFKAEQLERRDIQNMEDLATNTIGMTYNGGVSSGVQGSVTLRGLATNFIQDRFQNVGIYLDGLYLQRQSMMNVGMVDLARVEVVKGPQNAMYGRNAFAGAINYVTQKPGAEFEGYLMTTQGNNDRQDYRGAVGGALIDDLLFGRVFAGSSEYDGANKNPHPFADADIPGFHNEGNLGGWEDKVWGVAFLLTPTDSLQIGVNFNDSDLKREFQSGFQITGLQEVAAFGTSEFGDMNFNQKTTPAQGIPVPVTGNTLWQGELPTERAPGNYINPFGAPKEDTSVSGMVDPRAVGSLSDTQLFNLTLDWDINDDWSVRYQYGKIKHESQTSGPAARDPLEGSTYSDIVTTIHSSDFSSRPNSEMETQSHELHLDWNGGDKLMISAGLYYSQTDDESYDLTIFAPPCSDRDLNGDGTNADEIAGCSLAISPDLPSPLAAARFNGVLDFFDNHWGGNQSNLTQFDDTVTALFGTISYDLTDRVVLRAEGRYTVEDRKIKRLTDIFALEPGEVGTGVGIITGEVEFESTIVVPEDDDEFKYFAPRISLDWSWRDDSMVYAYAAKGVKSGGFNNSTSVEDLTYEIEENWTYELGSKNIFFDNRLTLNGALFFIDWTNLQGSLPPTVQSQNSNVVTGNIGDATNYGFEVEGTWRFNDVWSIDAGYTWIKPEYENGTTYDAAQRYYYYNCDQDFIAAGEVCGETDVGGNQLARTSTQQALAALNYKDDWGGWFVAGRVDASYRSKQYQTPLNVGYLGGRTLYNGSLSFSSPQQHWDVTVWGKNLTDKEYVSGSFTQSLFNRFLVAVGQGRSFGATVKYNF